MTFKTTRAVALAGASRSAWARPPSKSETPSTGATNGASAATPTSASSSTSAAAPASVPRPPRCSRRPRPTRSRDSGAFAGTVEDNGKKTTIDFKGTSDGKTADITIAMVGDGKARVISVPDGIFIKGDATFWKKQNAPAKVLAAKDKFIKAPASAASLTESLSLKAFLEKAFGAVTPSQVVDRQEETVNGIDTWVLTDTKGKSEGAIYVSKDGFEVVRFTGSTSSQGQLDFSQWNEDLGIKAPEGDQVLTLP